VGRKSESREKLALRGSWHAKTKIHGPQVDGAIVEPPGGMTDTLLDKWRDIQDGLRDRGLWDSSYADVLTRYIQVGEMFRQESLKVNPSVDSISKLGSLLCRMARELGLNPAGRQILKPGTDQEPEVDERLMRFFPKKD
jgi:hypothetical protein